MAVEIERKFLVAGGAWRAEVSGARKIRQAYLSKNGKASVRVRVVDESSARLTVKAAPDGKGPALSRAEFEYAIPVEEALRKRGISSRRKMDEPGKWMSSAAPTRGSLLRKSNWAPPMSGSNCPNGWDGK